LSFDNLGHRAKSIVLENFSIFLFDAKDRVIEHEKLGSLALAKSYAVALEELKAFQRQLDKELHKETSTSEV